MRDELESLCGPWDGLGIPKNLSSISAPFVVLYLPKFLVFFSSIALFSYSVSLLISLKITSLLISLNTIQLSERIQVVNIIEYILHWNVIL